MQGSQSRVWAQVKQAWSSRGRAENRGAAISRGLGLHHPTHPSTLRPPELQRLSASPDARVSHTSGCQSVISESWNQVRS